MNELSNEETHAANEKATPIYDSLIPWEEGHPTTEHFEVVETGDERGRGMKSKTAFQKGALAARLSGVITSHVTINTIQISPTLHFHDPWFCRFLLHSCDPNLAIDVTTLEARATRDIQPGDYVTIDYRATEDKIEFQFPCNCGAENCCGWMHGRLEKPSKDGANE